MRVSMSWTTAEPDEPQPISRTVRDDDGDIWVEFRERKDYPADEFMVCMTPAQFLRFAEQVEAMRRWLREEAK